MFAVCAAPSPDAIVRNFLAAADAHDVEAALGLLHEEFEFRDAEGSFRIDRESFRPLLAWDVAVDHRAESTITGVRGDTVAVALHETNDFLELLGIGPVRQEADFVVREGAIRTIVTRPDPGFFPRFEAALAPVLAWARRARPETLDRLLEEGALVYDGERGRLWLELLREARAAGVTGSAGTR